MAAYIIATIIVFVLVGLWIAQQFKPHAPMYCTKCGTVAPAKNFVPGSMGIELVAWLCFIIPGICYSLWRMSSRCKVCPKCLSKEVIPPDSPMAQKGKKDFYLEAI